jgi:ElaB/YqjD/DUF883 family membrane-anchored ribosome-binding protein
MTTHTTAYPEANAPHARKTSTDGHPVADAIEAAGPELKARMQQMMDNSKARATEWRDGFQDGVREKPIQSVLIAAAVGAVIGLIVGRRIS